MVNYSLYLPNNQKPNKMKKESRIKQKHYLTGFKALQKVVKILAQHDIYFYAGSVHDNVSIHIDQTYVILDAVFKINKVENGESMQYIYVDIDGIEVRIII